MRPRVSQLSASDGIAFYGPQEGTVSRQSPLNPHQARRTKMADRETIIDTGGGGDGGSAGIIVAVLIIVLLLGGGGWWLFGHGAPATGGAASPSITVNTTTPAVPAPAPAAPKPAAPAQ